MWVAVGIICSTVYKSKLTAILIKPRVWLPQTVQELVENDYNFRVMPKDWGVLKEGTNSTADSAYTKALEHAKDDLSYCDTIKRTIYGQAALLQEETPMQFQILKVCAEELTRTEYETLRIVNERIFPYNHAWPMQLAAPYVSRFSEYFQRLQAIGYIERLQAKSGRNFDQLLKRVGFRYQKYDTNQRIMKTNEAVPGNTQIIKMDHLVDSAFILVLGYLLSAAIFVVEIVMGNRKKRL